MSASAASQIPRLSVYILTYNEAEKITAAIQSVLWADEVLVIDSQSTDGTVELASSLGARVLQVNFKGFGDLRNQAIAACQYDWILSLDSDERCTTEAREEILAIIRNHQDSDLYFIPRKNYFMGRWIKYGGWYPNYRQPQLFRKGALSYGTEPVHETYCCHSKKPPSYLKNHLWQIPFLNLAEMMHKANRYSSLGVVRLSKKYPKASMFSAVSHSVWTFIKHFVLQRGCLDGWAGFVIAMGHSYGAFYRYAKYYEYQQKYPSEP